MAENYCNYCGNDMDLSRTCWMTLHGICCTEGCARNLIRYWHGQDSCTDKCKTW